MIDDETRHDDEGAVESGEPVEVWPGEGAAGGGDPIRPVGPSHVGMTRGRAEGVVHEQGDVRGRVAASVVAFAGLVFYLHSVWATANGVLLGLGAPEQTVGFFGEQVLQGTMGLVLLVLGVALYVLFLFFPSRSTTVSALRAVRRAALRPDRTTARVERTRRVKWWGLGVLGLGAVIVAYTLRWTAQNGVLYNVVLGGVRYQSFHQIGYVLVLVGLALFVPAAFREGPLADLAELGWIAEREDGLATEHGDEDGPDDLAEDREDVVPGT